MAVQLVHESGETYLETILVLRERLGVVRSIDLAHELGYTKPSVSRAMKLLKERGCITVGRGGAIELTELGMKEAMAIYERHKVITKFFTDILGVDAQTAEEDACRIEHVISHISFEKIKQQTLK